MINNEMQSVNLLSYSSGVDDYGQVRRSTPTTSQIDMFVKTYSQTNVSNPMYLDVELVGLTKADVTVDNMVQIDSIKYDVLHVLKTKRYNEVLLRKTSQ